jgi:hypothetical protein
MIGVSTGGWRSAERRLTVEENHVDTLLRETWSTGIGPAWVPFGIPMPSVDTGPAHTPALNNRGDGQFRSGVHSAQSWPIGNGLGVDAMISTPVTLRQWQTQGLSFEFGLDSTLLSSWDHRTGELPDAPARVCGWSYPGGGEGPEFADWLSLELGAPTAGVRFRAPPELRTGAWYRVRLQFFPDGRCGFALNGAPVYIGLPTSATQPAHLFLRGLSVRTKVLVGPIVMFSGVPTDIDWEHVASDSSRNHNE